MLNDLFLGFLQGVGLWYFFNNNSDLAIVLAIAIAAKTFVEYSLSQDALKTAASILATLLTAILSDFLYTAFEPRKHRKTHQTHQTHQLPRRSTHREQNGHAHRHRAPRTVSDITSVDTSSELISRQAMSPIERDIAALRARASLADSERRRFREERKWAVAQGNLALAAQLKWQVKRYSALMKSFHREADAKLVEASRSRPARQPSTRQPQTEERKAHHGTATTKTIKARVPQKDEHRTYNVVTSSRKPNGDGPTVSVDIAPSQLKSAIRVNVR